MAFTPYDWNQSIQTRAEYVEERLREGSPVAALSLPGGVLLATVHRTRRKLFEIYDRLAFAGVGTQSDIETMRNASLDFAHREGFQRSPDDVTAQRLVGSVLAPALKRAFADPFTAPLVFRGLFAELGETPAGDTYFTLGYDGEFRQWSGHAALSGSAEGEAAIGAVLAAGAGAADDAAAGLRVALEAWAAGWDAESRPDPETRRPPGEVLAEARQEGVVEAAWLERGGARESRFRLLTGEEIEAALGA